MIIGTVREIKDNEFRVGIVPGGVHTLVESGHTVLLESGAGRGSRISDREYEAVGARLTSSADEVWSTADIVVKVKEPLPEEYPSLRPGLTLFTYLHLAPLPDLTRVLMERKVTAIAYETITLPDGTLPLLTPMSEIAGRMAVQIGSHYLEKVHGGRGVLLGGVPGVPPGKVIILGGGVVGLNAAKIALGLGARVSIIEKNLARMQYLDDIFGGRVATVMSNPVNIDRSVPRADLLVGAVLVHGAAAPKVVTRRTVAAMKRGAVIVDVAVDQGGCIETTRPTSHSSPTYEEHGVLHYCVPNMPGAVPRTSTYALTNATLPFLLRMANYGVAAYARRDPGFAAGVNTYEGHLTCHPVGESQNLPVSSLGDLISMRSV
jgi:alanine dehydrogenase